MGFHSSWDKRTNQQFENKMGRLANLQEDRIPCLNNLYYEIMDAVYAYPIDCNYSFRFRSHSRSVLNCTSFSSAVPLLVCMIWVY
mmetsp:Transcript_258/g.336  ORF Transcript_258/g.336 Transcript_258/m.336 type:complete len:85 (-) Transcript_258:250-504(-)